MRKPRTLRLAEVKESFWLVPAVMAVGAVLAAIGLSLLELRLDLPIEGFVPGSAAGARALLSSIITAMISFTALVFSITVVALQLASSQYSPRVLRTFLRDRIIQTALGTFVATFLFAMVVLAALPAAESDRVPELALAVSMSLVLVSSGVFIYYLHHITTTMRVSHIIASIGAQTRRTMARYLPDSDERAPPIAAEVMQVVRAPKPGMVTHVDLTLLARLARNHGCAITVVPAPGDFVVSGAPLLHAHPVDGGCRRPLSATQAAEAVTLGVERTPGQDVGFGLRQLADIAQRALSPASSDVTTAVRAVQEAHDLLRRLAARPDPVWVVRDDDGTLRVWARPLSYEACLAMVVDDLRTVANGQPRITRLLDAMVADLHDVAIPGHQPSIRRRLVTGTHATDLSPDRGSLGGPPPKTF